MFRKRRERRSRRTVAVAGACPGSGTSFASLAIAWGMTLKEAGEGGPGFGRVSLTELGSAKLYRELDLSARLGAGGFQAYEDALSEMKGIGEVSDPLYGMELLARRPGGRELGAAELIRAAHSAPGDSAVLCCSGLAEDLAFEVLAASDIRLLVIDPLPSKLAESFRTIGRFRLDFPDGHLLVNRMNPGVFRGELRELLGTDRYMELPALPAELIYRAEYSASPVFELRKAAPLLKQPALDIVKRF